MAKALIGKRVSKSDGILERGRKTGTKQGKKEKPPKRIYKRGWDGLEPIFTNAEGLLVKVAEHQAKRPSPERQPRKLAIMARVTATQAKNEFGSILEQAIHQGPVAITRHDVPKAVLIPYAEYERLEKAQSNLLRDLESEFDDLLTAMQTAQSKRAVQTAFAASPAELGRAAVKQARKKR